jgi:hypothetical protein
MYLVFGELCDQCIHAIEYSQAPLALINIKTGKSGRDGMPPVTACARLSAECVCSRCLQDALGKHGIICIEDLIHEIYTVGPHFKEANNFLHPFQLSCPRGEFLELAVLPS